MTRTAGSAQEHPDSGQEPVRTVVVGLLCDPELPQEVAQWIAERLPGTLARRVDDTVTWNAPVATTALMAGLHSIRDVLDAAEDRRRREGWDYAIYVTDLPSLTTDGLRSRPIVADASARRGVAALSLPALGATGMRRRAMSAVLRLVVTLACDPSLGDETLPRVASRLADRMHALADRAGPDGTDVDHRLVATPVRGRMRLLAGMVHCNRPARLVFGMTGAVAAAVAFSVFMLQSSTIFMIAAAAGPGRLALLTAGAVTVMVGWIVVAHDLWERSGNGLVREEALLYNAATVLTLTTGVLVAYGITFAFDAIAAAAVLDPDVLGTLIGRPAGAWDHVRVAWLSASAATVAGAVGSTLENRATVRQAVYGFREYQRRLERDRPNRDDQADV